MALGTGEALQSAFAADADGRLLTGGSGSGSSTTVTATLANVAGSASSVTLRAAATSRRGLNVFNDSSAALYIKFGATASTSSFTVKVAAGGYYEMPSPVYQGIVDGIWDSATGNARVTELS